MIAVVVAVADCQRVQTNWFRLRASALGGEAWTDGPSMWIEGPDNQNLTFSETMSTTDVLRGIDRTRERGRAIVGA
ncbi:MAG: hypothetical protein ACR2P2_20880 [Nakamurella sp.]